jgi:hypothetical protein
LLELITGFLHHYYSCHSDVIACVSVIGVSWWQVQL